MHSGPQFFRSKYPVEALHVVNRVDFVPFKLFSGSFKKRTRVADNVFCVKKNRKKRFLYKKKRNKKNEKKQKKTKKTEKNRKTQSTPPSPSLASEESRASEKKLTNNCHAGGFSKRAA